MQLHHGSFDAKAFVQKGPLGFVVLFTLVLVSPLIISRLLPYNSANFVKDFSIAAGMIALMLLIMSFFYTGRFNFVSKKRGIDLSLALHRRMVGLALLLAIVHIVLISSFAMPDSFTPLLIALFLIVTQMIVTKLRKKITLKYEWWRAIHELFAIIIISIIVFHAITEGQYSSQPAMTFFWIAALGTAILSLLYVHHYLPIANSKKPYRIVELKEIANKQWNLVIEPVGHEGLDYQPGQFAFVSFGWTPIRSISNPFSICSAPADKPKISFTIKEVGDLTSKLDSMPLDTQVYLYGPYGHMNREIHKGPANRGIGSVMIAGGIGITPMISMIRDRQHTGDKDPVKLIYACQNEKDFLYTNELTTAAEDSNVDIVYFASAPSADWKGRKGRIDFEFLNEYLDFEGYDQYLYFICGTSPFAQQMLEHLEKVGGIPVFNIVYEDFSVYD